MRRTRKRWTGFRWSAFFYFRNSWLYERIMRILWWIQNSHLHLWLLTSFPISGGNDKESQGKGDRQTFTDSCSDLTYKLCKWLFRHNLFPDKTTPRGCIDIIYRLTRAASHRFRNMGRCVLLSQMISPSRWVLEILEIFNTSGSQKVGTKRGKWPWNGMARDGPHGHQNRLWGAPVFTVVLKMYLQIQDPKRNVLEREQQEGSFS